MSVGNLALKRETVNNFQIQLSTAAAATAAVPHVAYCTVHDT